MISAWLLVPTKNKQMQSRPGKVSFCKSAYACFKWGWDERKDSGHLKGDKDNGNRLKLHWIFNHANNLSSLAFTYYNYKSNGS